ncbi:hypothetical protein BDK51DRAFT_38055 [Blyttiomyces helicus]|uniref:Uncharacterized protein n=1 Tax=Blyttiomyces helicus TaxID=388810 RepID=A0A4P9WHX3_9FUNG|nr:hypothetical protein BDK51DRAFT_38055 [Blyttiomyces helicus]|eukprot:RKO92441.1 hypothetical protein BDK51DRAFT_38055 [Blyttiomyces helicus]
MKYTLPFFAVAFLAVGSCRQDPACAPECGPDADVPRPSEFNLRFATCVDGVRIAHSLLALLPQQSSASAALSATLPTAKGSVVNNTHYIGRGRASCWTVADRNIGMFDELDRRAMGGNEVIGDQGGLLARRQSPGGDLPPILSVCACISARWTARSREKSQLAAFARIICVRARISGFAPVVFDPAIDSPRPALPPLQAWHSRWSLWSDTVPRPRIQSTSAAVWPPVMRNDGCGRHGIFGLIKALIIYHVYHLTRESPYYFLAFLFANLPDSGEKRSLLSRSKQRSPLAAESSSSRAFSNAASVFTFNLIPAHGHRTGQPRRADGQTAGLRNPSSSGRIRPRSKSRRRRPWLLLGDVATAGGGVSEALAATRGARAGASNLGGGAAASGSVGEAVARSRGASAGSGSLGLLLSDVAAEGRALGQALAAARRARAGAGDLGEQGAAAAGGALGEAVA